MVAQATWLVLDRSLPNRHHRREHRRDELGLPVFCAEGGRAFKENECKWPMWRACKNAGLRRISWHVLRHTFPSHLVMKGVPLKAVQELMSHATIE
jgi:site-specific recombinase XerD